MRRLSVSIVALLFLFCSTIHAGKRRQVYTLNLSCSDAQVQASINGMPVGDGEIHSLSSDIGAAVQQGKNTIDVDVTIPSDSKPSAKPEVTLKLKYIDVDMSNTKDMKTTTLLSHENIVESSQSAGQSKHHSFEFEVKEYVIRSLPWNSPGGELDDADRQAVESLIGQLRQAYVEKSSENVTALKRSFYERMAASKAMSFEDLCRMASDQDKRFIFGSSNYQVLATSSPRLKIQNINKLNLYRVTCEDGSPAITAKVKDGSLSVRPYVSKIDGKWIIVQ